MQIRSNDIRQPTLSPTSVAQTSAPTVAPAVRAKAAPQGAASASTFERSSFSTPSARRAPVELSGQSARTVVPTRPGPVEPSSVEGRAAVQTSLAALGEQLKGPGASRLAPVDASKSFDVRSIERDELGMTHVRMDRKHEGLRVFGEQVISHLDRDGKLASITGEVSKLPKGVAGQPMKVSADQALALAQKDFAGKTDRKPTVEKVLYKGEDGQYRAAFHVELSNTSKLEGQERPRRMNYLIDAQTGSQVKSYNQIGGIELPHEHRAARAEPATVTATATPNAPIKDHQTTTSTVELADDVSIENLKLDLDLAHTYQGDLKVTLTSPSGKSAVLHDRKGGGLDDIKGSFDLSKEFAGESTKGKWTLTVEDKAKRDEGTLKSWGLSATGKKGEVPPPPPPPPGTGDDTSLYSGKVDLATKQNADGTYSLEDSTRGKGVVTLDAQNKQRPSGATPIKDNNNVWGEATDPTRNKAAVDAHYGAQMTYDFMKNVLGRDSLDGKGEKLVSNVHINNNYVNAFWDGKQMNYGDGDGKQAGPLTTLDIAGHEIAHGLTERTAGLIYSGESGGLNEAFSDIMGTGVEWYASQKNQAVKFDWAVGEDAWTPNNGDATDALRYMDDPTKDGYSVDHYSNYPKQTEVHGSSGIANNAFYLLANGGTNKTSGQKVDGGIGMEKGLKIYYRALAHYMTPSTTFAQAREATLKAATDLYGADSVEAQKVKQSWSAVGVQ